MSDQTLDREIDNKRREVEYLTKMLDNAKRDLHNLEWKKRNGKPTHK